jgi:hypothetical protein
MAAQVGEQPRRADTAKPDANRAAEDTDDELSRAGLGVRIIVGGDEPEIVGRQLRCSLEWPQRLRRFERVARLVGDAEVGVQRLADEPAVAFLEDRIGGLAVKVEEVTGIPVEMSEPEQFSGNQKNKEVARDQPYVVSGFSRTSVARTRTSVHRHGR